MAVVGGIEYRTTRNDAEAQAARDFALFFNGAPACSPANTTPGVLARVLDRAPVRWVCAYADGLLVGVIGVHVHVEAGFHIFLPTACMAPGFDTARVYRNLNATVGKVIATPGCCENRAAALIPSDARLSTGELMIDLADEAFGPLAVTPFGTQGLVRMEGALRSDLELT